MIRFVALVSCALLIASCRGSAANVVLASLDRSEKIDLLCADVEQVTGNLFDVDGALPRGTAGTAPVATRDSNDPGPVPAPVGAEARTSSPDR